MNPFLVHNEHSINVGIKTRRASGDDTRAQFFFLTKWKRAKDQKKKAHSKYNFGFLLAKEGL